MMNNSPEYQGIQMQLQTLAEISDDIYASVVDNNYLKAVSRDGLLTIADVFSLKPFNNSKITLGSSISELIAIEGENSISKTITNISNAYKKIIINGSDDPSEIALSIDEIYHNLERLDGLKLNVKGSHNIAGLKNLKSDEAERVFGSLRKLLETSLPTVLRSSDAHKSQIPRQLLEIEKPEAIEMSDIDLLKYADKFRLDENIDVRIQSYSLRFDLFTRLISQEINNSLNTDLPQLPIVTMSILGRMYSNSRSGGDFTAIIDNFISDTLSLLTADNESNLIRDLFIKNVLDLPFDFFNLISRLDYSHRLPGYLGRAIILRDSTDFSSIEALKIITAKISKQNTGLLSGFSKSKNLSPTNIIKGAQTVGFRSVVKDSEISELIVNVPDLGLNSSELDILFEHDTEIGIESNVRELSSAIAINEDMRGYIKLNVSELDDSVMGVIRFVSKDKKRQLFVNFSTNLFNLTDIDIELIDQELSGINKYKIASLVATAINGEIETLKTQRKSAAITVKKDDSSQTVQQIPNHREMKIAKYNNRSAAPEKRRSNTRTSQKKQTKIESLQHTNQIRPERTASLLGLEKLKLELESELDQGSLIYEKAVEKFTYKADSLNSSSRQFGKPVETSEEFKDIPLRQVNIKSGVGGGKELRFYFLSRGKVNGGSDINYEFVGFYHKHDKREQTLYIERLLRRIKDEQEM